MKKLLFVLFCIANILCASENNSWQLNKWYEESLEHIKNAEKLPKNNLTFFDSIQSNNKNTKLQELKTNTENINKYYTELTPNEYRKTIGFDMAKNVGKTLLAMGGGTIAMQKLPELIDDFIFQYNHIYLHEDDERTFFPALITASLITILSMKYTWRYSKAIIENMKDCVYTEDALLNKQKIAFHNLKKITDFHNNKIISKNDL